MSKNDEQASAKALAGQQNDSVFDFLYCDTRRIGSFLSQFDPSGHLTSLTQSENAALGVSPGFRVAVGGGATVLGTGGSANVAFEKAARSDGSEGVQRVYDPLWANALNFLDLLTEKSLLNKVVKANLGQFVQVDGLLSVIDVSIVRDILQSPLLKKRLAQDAAAAPEHSTRNQRRNAATPGPSDTDVGMELMGMFPLTAQATMISGDDFIWSTLSPSALTVTYGDLLLQHGVNIPGKWHMVAILDSKPNLDVPEAPVDERLLPTATGLAAMIPTMKNMLGKPPSAFGVTPLLIFRAISG